MTEPARRRSIPSWLAAGGGVLAVVGSILTWATVNPRRGSALHVNGTELFAGISVACGLAALVAGLLLREPGRARGILAAVVLAGGLAAAGVAAYVTFSDQAVIDRLADESGRPRIGRGRRGVDVTPGVGVFLVLGGGVLAAAGGVGGLLSARERGSTEAAATSVVDASRSGGENAPTTEGES